MPLEDWLAALASEASPERLAPVRALVAGREIDAAREVLTPDRALSVLDSSASHRVLAELGVGAPAIDEAWCRAVIERLAGVLPQA